MTNEFKRMVKTVCSLVSEVRDQRTESYGWTFCTDKNFEKIYVKFEINRYHGYENHYFYIAKDEMEKTEKFLNSWMEFELSIPHYREIPIFTNKREFVRWFDGREFLEVGIENDENNENLYHIIFNCYEEELYCDWKGEYEELNKILNSLCDLYLIHINENVQEEVMEMLAIVILSLVALAFFKRPVKRIAKHTDKILAVNMLEDDVDLTTRANQAKQDLIERNGEDFQTVDEVWDFFNKRTRKKNS